MAIARAILRDAPILILDEPTSALDAGSEELLVRRWTTCRRGGPGSSSRTGSRRCAPPTAILVLRAGRLVEAGTHEELCRRPGTYQRMVSLQDGHRRIAAAASREV